jgi:hypothetical protein
MKSAVNQKTSGKKKQSTNFSVLLAGSFCPFMRRIFPT